VDPSRAGSNIGPHFPDSCRGTADEPPRPDANITGITTLGNELESKRLQLLRELLPPGPAVALLVNSSNGSARANVDDVQAAARILGVRLLTLRVGVWM
jgi:hypothetical protein